MDNKDIVEQAIRTLSEQIVKAVRREIQSAPFAAFRTATVRKHISGNRYQVSMDDRLIELAMYGNGTLKNGETVYVVSPQNSKNYHDMFILGK